MKSCLAVIVMMGLSWQAGAQDFHGPLQPVAEYSQCVAERARALRPATNAVDEAIAKAMDKCKGQRSRALSATRARMKTLGLSDDAVKQSGVTMFTSMETSMKESLHHELVSADKAQPNDGVVDGS